MTRAATVAGPSEWMRLNILVAQVVGEHGKEELEEGTHSLPLVKE